MEIVDLTDDYEDLYLICLEDWSSEMQEAGDHKARWYAKMRSRGLGVKLAIDEEGRGVGMIQYIPIEHSPALGTDLYMILCIWVHGHKPGVGNRQGHGVGTALLSAAEQDVRERGAKGIVAWGVTLPFWMKARWFRKHGFRRVDRNGMRALLWKPFAPDAEPPRWIESGPRPEPVEGKIAVTAYANGWCPANNIVYERAKRAAASLGDDVVFTTIDTSEQADMVRCGQSDCIFLDGKVMQKGPPLSYERVRKKMARRVARLNR